MTQRQNQQQQQQQHMQVKKKIQYLQTHTDILPAVTYSLILSRISSTEVSRPVPLSRKSI